MNEQAAVAQKTALTTSVKEKLLVPLALLVAVLFDRLVINLFFDMNFLNGVGTFWLCFLAGFYVFYWERLKKEKLLWYVAACAAALCVWNFVFNTDANAEYSLITFLVIPGVLMLHTQMSAGNYPLKRTGQMAIAWISGWFLSPFSGLPAMYRATGSLVTGDGKKDAVRKSAFGILFALLLLSVIVPLLSGADKVFGYYVNQMLTDISISSLVGHSIVVLIAFALFYSFLWNVGFGEKGKTPEVSQYSIDSIISGIVLGTVSVVYVIFCAVQFTYLFAGAGLPNGMTYSAYAREGFAQTVVVCAINLLVFGVFLRYSNHFSGGKLLRCLLAVLLGLTGIMLISGGVRLSLYIDAYGLTWLRLLSGWFIVYLVAVVLLCAVRMYLPKIPLIVVCAMLLLGWYVVLGYANPDALVGWYNERFGYEVVLNPHSYRY